MRILIFLRSVTSLCVHAQWTSCKAISSAGMRTGATTLGFETDALIGSGMDTTREPAQ